MKILLLLLHCILLQNVFSQSISEDLGLNFAEGRTQEPFTEKVLIIGHSKKILILTNQQAYLQKGDFITILLNNVVAVRALVGKIQDTRAGIKVLKIFSLDTYNKIKQGDNVKIVIGDYQFIPKEEGDDKDDLDSLGINDQDDLFNDSVDINLEDNVKRRINTHNIIYFSWGPYSADAPLNQIQQGETETEQAYLDNRGSQTYNDYSLGWARQINDNIYAEGLIDFITLSGFPSPDISSVLQSYAIRLKYVYELPSYFFAMPFIGYRLNSIKSSDAGIPNANQASNTPLLNAESKAVDQFLGGDSRSSRELIFGVTLLRRFVPGWFIKSDLELSQNSNFRFNIGLAVEF